MCYLAETFFFFLFLLPFSFLFCRKVMVPLRSGFIQLLLLSFVCVMHTVFSWICSTRQLLILFCVWMCMPVCAWACLYHYINHIYNSFSIYKARLLRQIEAFPHKHGRCNWSHVSQMREFQTLLDFSGTSMSCGFGPDGSTITQYC